MVARMAEDEQKMWSDEIRERIIAWAAWSRGNQLIRGSEHVLASMIKKAAGEVPGTDLSFSDDFTPAIEAIDKSIARLKMEANEQHTKQKRYMKEAKRVLMSVYLGQRSTIELAEKMDVSEDYVKQLLWYAESYVGRVFPDIESDLLMKQKRANLHRV